MPDRDADCVFCGKPTESLAGNPGLWPLVFTHPDGTGIPYHHHVQCVQHRLFGGDDE